MGIWVYKSFSSQMYTEAKTDCTVSTEYCKSRSFMHNIFMDFEPGLSKFAKVSCHKFKQLNSFKFEFPTKK